MSTAVGAHCACGHRTAAWTTDGTLNTGDLIPDDLKAQLRRYATGAEPVPACEGCGRSLTAHVLTHWHLDPEATDAPDTPNV